MAGELAGVELHEAQVNGPALRDQGSRPRCGLLRRRRADRGSEQAARTVGVDADDEGIAAAFMDGDGSQV